MNFQYEEASLKSTLKKKKKQQNFVVVLCQARCQSSRSDLIISFKQVLGNLQFNLGELFIFRQFSQCQKKKKKDHLSYFPYKP